MKKLIYFALLFAIVISSRNKDVKTICSECEKNKPINEKLILKIGKSDFTTDIKYWNYKKINLTFKTIEERNFNDIVSKLQESTKFSKSPYAIVLFTNNLLGETKMVSDTNIIGMSFFYVENSKMFHSFYKRTPSGFLNDDNLNCEVEGIISNDLHKLTLGYFDTISTPKRSWVLLFSNSNINNKLSNPKHELSIRLQKQLSLKSAMAPPDDCAPPSTDGGEEPCHISPLYGSTCNGDEEKPCLENTVDVMVRNNNITTYETSAFNYSLHHKFRDEFLNNSPNGLIIIKDYYFLSDYYKNKVSLTLALETITTLFYCNNAISVILDRDNQAIAITSDLSYRINVLIDHYILITDSPEIVSRLESYKLLGIGT